MCDCVALYIIIIFMILSFIFIYHAHETKHRQDEYNRAIREEKRLLDERNESLKFGKTELLFRQNQEFISKLFESKNYYTKQELKAELALKYPNESQHFYNVLYFDLFSADLIGTKYFQYSEDLYIKGNSFFNLIISFPRLIAFLHSKTDFPQTQVSHELCDKFLVRSGYIKTKIRTNPDTYYVFGVALGEELPKEVNTSGLEIFPKNFYLYNSPLGFSYMLKNDLLTTEYQQIFENWIKGENGGFLTHESKHSVSDWICPENIDFEDLIM